MPEKHFLGGGGGGWIYFLKKFAAKISGSLMSPQFFCYHFFYIHVTKLCGNIRRSLLPIPHGSYITATNVHLSIEKWKLVRKK